MKIKKTNMLIIFLFLVAIISLGSVAATDTVINSTDNSNVIDTNETTGFQEVISNETVNQENIDTCVMLDDEMSLMKENSSLNDSKFGQVNYENDSFTALNKLITDDTTGTIILQHDYIMYSNEVSTYANGIVINKNITIMGNGHCINANKIGRIFNITNDGVVLTLKNITLKNGNIVSGDRAVGGAIYSNSTVNLICENVDFINNSASGFDCTGGAIYAKRDVNVNGTLVNFVNNSANYNVRTGHYSWGGAIVGDNVNINAINISFVNNNAYCGGAINANRGVNVNGTLVNFVNNSAYVDGAIYAGSSVIFNSTSVSFVNNSAHINGDIHHGSYGSAIQAGSGVIINAGSVNFINNSANVCSAIKAGSGVIVNAGSVSFINNNGGAINAGSGVIVNAGSVSFVNNSATGLYDFGGAISASNVTVNTDTVSFVNNSARYGGAISAYYGVSVTGADVSFVNNKATMGGAIHTHGSISLKSTGSVSFVNNSAQYGDSLYLTGRSSIISDCEFTNELSNNSQIYLVYGNLTLSNNTFKVKKDIPCITVKNEGWNNPYIVSGVTATVIGNQTVNVTRPNSYLVEVTFCDDNGNSIAIISPNATITIDNKIYNLINNNSTVHYVNVSTVGIMPNSYVVNTSSSVLTNLTVKTGTLNVTPRYDFTELDVLIKANNTITLDYDYTMFADEVNNYFNGIVINKNITVIGNGHCINANKTGRIFNITTEGVVLTLKNITLKNGNMAKCNSAFGGAIYSNSSVTLICENVNFVNNTAYDGGAIYASDNVTVNADSVSFVNNSATGIYGCGGAIYASDNVTVNVDSVNFVNNSATRGSGGAIYASDSVIVNATDSVNFTGNTASTFGGAIYAKSGRIIVNSTTMNFVINNAYCGGAIFTTDGSVIVNSTSMNFVNNSASTNGGAIYASDSVMVNAGSVSFVNNIASENGGAIRAYMGVIVNAGSVSFVNNNASYGGAIYASDSVMVNAGNVSFINNKGNNVIFAIFDGSIVNSTFVGNHNVTGIRTVYNGCILTILVNNKSSDTINPNENFNLTAKLVDDKGNTYYSDGLTYQIYNNGALIRNLTNVDELFNAIANLTDSGVYYITAKYIDPDNKITRYTISNATVYINSNNVTLTGKDIIKYYKGDENYNIYLKLADGTPLAGETVAVTVNGKTYNFVTDNNGLISLPIGLSAGNYTIFSVYNGYYGVSTLKNNIAVKPTIKGKDTTVYYRNGSSYIVHVMDSQGRTVVGQTVRMNINGVFYDRVTDSNGYAFLPIGLTAGKYIITAENPTNGEMTSNIVTVLPTLVDGQDVSVYHRNGSGYSIKVLDGQGNPAKGVTVRMNINGVFYDRVTDSNGYAFLPIGLSPGEYIITTEYNGFMTSNKITVLPVLIGNDISLYYRDGTSYKVKLLNGQGKPLTYTNVTMNINGVFYYRTTNTDGVADLPIGLLPGQYIITTTYQDHVTSNTVTVLSRD